MHPGLLIFPENFLKRYWSNKTKNSKMKKKSKISLPKNFKPQTIVAIILTLIIGFFGGLGYSKYFPTRQQAFPTKSTVERVIDGDTIELTSG